MAVHKLIGNITVFTELIIYIHFMPKKQVVAISQYIDIYVDNYIFVF